MFETISNGGVVVAHRGGAHPNHRQVRRVADQPDKRILSATASLFHPSRCPHQSFSQRRGPKNSARGFRASLSGKKTDAFTGGSTSHCQRRRGNGKGFSVGDRRGSSKPTGARDGGIHQNALAAS